ncbi:MAG TPA: isochorismatase family cysteine hydrolase [Actinomycetales bacterium]|nr:isochorismatase family cysteine hydrolase [Actinomycetales bacterium]
MTDTFDPATTGLVVFDMLEAYREPIEAAGSIEPTVQLIAGCRRRGVPVLYARADHRADGMDFARSIADTDSHFRPWGPDNPLRTKPPHASGSAGLEVLREIAPQPGDYDVPKHRWSAFCGTHLELSLRSRGIDSILLVGGSVHVGIASTAFAARDMDFQVTVVSDCCHGFELQRQFFMEHVFPRMCHVRTSAEVLRGLAASEGEPNRLVG